MYVQYSLDLQPGSNPYGGVVSSYTIGETAVRSGFTTSALRYYEGVGLVEPAARTSAGYRIYDDNTLARLAFIGRAKQLGCSLREITDLVGIWDGERCDPVQRRFHELITDKLQATRQQIVELSTFTAQLQTAAGQLSSQPVDGPCGDGCACMADTAASSTITALEFDNTSDDAPIACTLEPGAIPERLADWGAILDRALARRPLEDGALRIEFGDEIDVAELAQLVAAEQHCCGFFSFAITVDPRGVGLEVRAPGDAADVVASLFG